VCLGTDNKENLGNTAVPHPLRPKSVRLTSSLLNHAQLPAAVSIKDWIIWPPTSHE
jgi:hypothetical protein